MRQVIIFNLMLLVTIGCTKFGKNITVKGRALNPITGEGIPNARVIITKSTLEYPSGVKVVKETTTDSEGYFEISKLSLSKCYVKCQVTEAGDYYPIGWEKSVPLFDDFTISAKKGKTMHADFYAVPYGNLILNIQNVNCGGSGDTMYFRKKWVGYSDFEGSYSTPRTGCYSYTSPSAFQVPMGTYVYEMKVIRSGITTYVYDTIVVPKTGVVTINMDY